MQPVQSFAPDGRASVVARGAVSQRSHFSVGMSSRWMAPPGVVRERSVTARTITFRAAAPSVGDLPDLGDLNLIYLARGGFAFRPGETLSRVWSTGQARSDNDLGLLHGSGFGDRPGPPGPRGAVRAVLVVLPPSRLGLRSDVVETQGPARVRALPPQPVVEALDEVVVGRLTRPAETHRHPGEVRPQGE